MRKFQTPLGIIAIFASLSEIAGATVLPMLDNDLQHTFIWFVIGFPLILLLLFFITLNFNTKVLYSPREYKDEKNFVDLFNEVKTSEIIQMQEDNILAIQKEFINLRELFVEIGVKENFERVDESLDIINGEIKETIRYHEIISTNIRNNRRLVNVLIENSRGVCDLCNKSTDIVGKSGKPYLEAHHIVPLSTGGEDTVENISILCPNCHKKVHLADTKYDKKLNKKAIRRSLDLLRSRVDN